MKKTYLFILLVLIASATFAGTVKKTYYFSAPNINYYGDYQTVTFSKTLATGIKGEPTLPYYAVSLLVPPGEIATSIELISEDKITIDGNFKLFPYQSSKPLSDMTESEFQINEKVYKLDSNYPHKPMGGLSTGYLGGYSIAMSTFTPIEYIPTTGKISYYKKVTIIIETSSDNKASAALNNMSSSLNAKSRLLNFVQNPEDLNQYNPPLKRSANDYSLLIITPNQFTDGFEELRNIYLSRGIKSEIITSEYILTNVSGQDLQEKIRNFIIQEYQESGIDYVILGGDVEHIPYRGFYCYVQSGSGYNSSNIPADLYYSALDGTWNDDGDNDWGEPDEDDLLPEVAVARYPFNNTTELERIIHKTISYQNSPVLGEFTNPLLAGEHLYSDPETWGRDYLDLLIGERSDNGYTTIGIPESYPIDSIYEHNSPWSGNDLINEINQGTQFVHHVGHASPTYVAHLNNSDITNSNFYAVNGVDHNYTLMQTHGCDCGSFDYDDCILEKMVTIDNFAVSVIGNSRYGWFNEGQSEGPAAHLHREMVDALYHEKLNHLGNAFVESKIQTAPWVEAPGQHEEGALRWNFYDINILGDPALSVWTAEPINIDVINDSEITIGTVSTNVNVSSNGLPMESFTCSILKDGVLHATGDTDANGDVTLIFDPEITDVGDAMLIVVGYNCLPDTNYISFIPAESAYVIYADHEILDAEGNNNGMADFGETISLTVSVTNLGTEDATDVSATLSVDDSFISIIDDTESYGYIAAGNTANKTEAFSFDISDNIPDQHRTVFTLICESDGISWVSDFEVVINAPMPEIGDMIINDIAGGNGNGQLDPGESVILTIPSLNSGHSDCSFAEISLTSDSPYLTIDPNIINLSGLQSGESKLADFNIDIDNETPIGTLVTFGVELNACGYIFQRAFNNNIGLIIEDFESGDFSSFEWQLGGNAGWEIFTQDPFNGTYCSKSGDISDYGSSELLISLFVMDDDEISFARKVSSEVTYDFLSFYIDGNKVEEWSGEEEWEVVTFDIESGHHTLLWSYEKDVSYATGSDCGWIDDITFPASTTVIDVSEIESTNEFIIYPNPGLGYYSLILNSNTEVADVTVYNSIGSVVSSLKAEFTSGRTTVDLSNLMPGLYFIEINTENSRMVRKVVQK